MTEINDKIAQAGENIETLKTDNKKMLDILSRIDPNPGD